jgi:DNA-binding NarL/FixJ family response regulator/signal transduction histidine kinase
MWSGFYFDQYALSSLAQLILTLVITLYLLRVKERTTTTRLFTLFFAAMTAYAVFSTLAGTAVWSRRFYAVHLQLVALSLALVAILQFAYRFPEARPNQRQEARVVLLFSLLATTLAAGWAIYQFRQLRPGGEPSTDTQPIDLWLAAGFLWLITVFWRRSYTFSRQHAPQLLWWRHLYRPQGRAAQAAFAFVLAFLLAVALSGLSAALVYLPGNTVTLRSGLASAGVLLNLFIIAVIYFNYASERTTFMAKLVGICLVALLLILGSVGAVVAPTYNWPLPENTTVPHTIRFTPQPDGSYSMLALPGQLIADWGDELLVREVELPFDFPFAGRAWHEVRFRYTGALLLEPQNRWRFEYNWQPAILAIYYTNPELMSNLFAHVRPDKAVFTWNIATNPSMVAQTVLYPDGRIDLNYDRITFGPENRFGLQFGNGRSDFAPFDPAATYTGERIIAPGALTHFPIQSRQYLDEQLRPLVYLMLVASLLLVVGLPLFFQPTLVRPLNNLVAGVTAVNQGNLQVEVPIQSYDEIGYVTQAFNRMVQSVRQVDEELEHQVKERTEALIVSERRVLVMAERERIGRDLHDNLGQLIGYLSVQIQTVRTLLERGQEEQVAATLAQLENVAQEAHHGLRQMILGIRTSAAQQPADFPALLDQYLTHLQQRYGLTVQASLPDELRTMPLAAEVETQLLRIIQEALTNVHKHAQTSRAHLIFTLHRDEAQVIITDEGQGFDPGETPKSQIPNPKSESQIENPKSKIQNPESPQFSIPADSSHFGLEIMRERAESVGGTLEIRSAPGKGTQVIARLPRLLPLPTEEMVQGIRVLLVDDHALYREGLHNLLRTRGLQVVGQAENGEVAQQLARQLRPDLILMDVEMPVCDGLEATRRIKASQPEIKIVMLTVSVAEDRLYDALRLGASGYLLKSLPGNQFFSLLAEVLRGETIISPELATRVLADLTAAPPAMAATAPLLASSSPPLITPTPALTPRQREVLERVAQGYTNKEIAQVLYISENTVKFHIRATLEQLQLRNRYELAQYAQQQGLSPRP